MPTTNDTSPVAVKPNEAAAALQQAIADIEAIFDRYDEAFALYESFDALIPIKRAARRAKTGLRKKLSAQEESKP